MIEYIEHFGAGRAVGVPFVQSLITGVLMFVVVLALSWLLEVDEPIMSGLLAGSVAACVAWLSLLSRWLGLADSMAGAYYGQADDSEPVEDFEHESVRIELVQDNGRNMQFFDLPASEQQLSMLADGLLRGTSFSEASWSGNGALFSRSQFRQIRNEWLKRGWLSWVNPQARAQGMMLTPAGKAVARHFASMAADGQRSPALVKRDS